MNQRISSCNKSSRSRTATSRLTSALGLSAGAVGVAELAQADSADAPRTPHTLLLPGHYELLDDGRVVFALKNGEQLSLTDDQYVLLDSGLLLVVDELAQDAMAELPVMGTLRTQLMTEVEPVRSPDGSIVEVSSSQPLWSGEGPTQRLLEEVDLQTYELAQDKSQSNGSQPSGGGAAVGATAGSLGGLAALAVLFSSEEEEAEPEPEPAPTPRVGAKGFVINGTDANDSSGRSVSYAGDINNDGLDDIIIGAPQAGPNGAYEAGESYVVFGKAAGYSASLELSSLNGTNGFVINGIDAEDHSGRSVSSAGDINNDGFDDIIIGARRASRTDGQSYVVFGEEAGNYPASLELSSLNGNNGFAIN